MYCVGMFRDVGYARISRDDMRAGRGVGRQTKDVEGRSQETGGQLVAPVFIDNDISASRFSKKARKDYRKVLDLIRAGTVDRVIIYRIDRLLRIPRELEDLIDLAEQHGVLLVNMHGSVDPTTAEGRKYLRDRVADAAYETDIMSERWKRTFDERAANGEPHGSRSFGYSCAGRSPCELEGCQHDGLSIVEPESEAFRRACADVLAGESITGIARRWNAAGIKPVHAEVWNSTLVRSVLTGRHQAGLRVHRGDVVGDGAWDPIIDRDTHDAIVRVLTDPDRKRKMPPRRHEFSGLIRTAEGHTLTRDVVRGRPTYRFVKQPGRTGPQHVTIAAEPLEDLVREMLFQEVESGRVDQRIAARRLARPRPVGEDPAEVKRRLVQLAEDEANDVIDRAEWLAKKAVLQRRLEAAEAGWAQGDDSLEALAGVDPDIRARWRLAEDEGGYSVDRKRAILAAVFERVVIHPALRRGPGLDPRRVEPVHRA